MVSFDIAIEGDRCASAGFRESTLPVAGNTLPSFDSAGAEHLAERSRDTFVPMRRNASVLLLRTAGRIASDITGVNQASEHRIRP